MLKADIALGLRAGFPPLCRMAAAAGRRTPRSHPELTALIEGVQWWMV